jgi:hypothetical protein
LAATTLKPGMASRELDTFLKAWEGVLNQSKGFDIILSDSDIRLLATLCERFLVPKVEALGADPSLEALAETLKDPDGTKKMEAAARAKRAAIQRAREKIMQEAREKEARIQAESNIIGPDGNPSPHAKEVSHDGQKVDPKLHPEMTSDLKSIIENNLAVMTSASGKPITNKEGPNTVTAKPGGTPVSHNPKDYQNSRVAPGQPDYFN